MTNLEYELEILLIKTNDMILIISDILVLKNVPLFVIQSFPFQPDEVVNNS